MKRLGMASLSSGNRHPYSWSAICNGYNEEQMRKLCPFPVIPNYLSARVWPTARVEGAIFSKKCPSKQMLKQSECFASVKFLLSEDSSAITENVLVADGGWGG